MKANELADIYRNPTDPRWSQAFETIARLVLEEARRRPPFSEMDSQSLSDEARSLAGQLWCRLIHHPARLQAHSVRGWGAIRTEIRRMLTEMTLTEPSTTDDHRFRLRHHLRRLVLETLKDNDEFLQVVRDLWGLSAESWSPKLSERLSPEDILAPLPPLPSSLDPYHHTRKTDRAEEIPPVVRRSALRPHLRAVLETARRHCSTNELLDLSWRALSPHPDQTFLLTAEPLDGKDGLHQDLPCAPAAADRSADWSLHVDVEVSALLDWLEDNPDIARVALLSFDGPKQGRPTVRAVAGQLGLGKTKSNTHQKTFAHRLKAVADKYALGDTEKKQLLRMVLDNLRVEGFLHGEKEATP